MINLPENFLSKAYVDNTKGILWLFFKNSADQYFIYRYPLDPAFSMEDHLTKLEAMKQIDQKAIYMKEDLSTEFIEPSAQDWEPVPLPVDSIISFAQYQAHSSMAKTEDLKAAREGKNAEQQPDS